jgi:hypothetical protein
VGIFLPTIQRTSLDFLRDILKEEKWHLKQKDVIHLEVPHYSELSVKSLYSDALADDTLKMYLPSKKQVSNKLPEREFFFGVIGTLKKLWLTEVIRVANEKRNKASEEAGDKNRIVISQSWMKELTAHPYFSRNIKLITFIRQTWDWGSSSKGERKTAQGAQSEENLHNR